MGYKFLFEQEDDRVKRIDKMALLMSIPIYVMGDGGRPISLREFTKREGEYDVAFVAPGLKKDVVFQGLQNGVELSHNLLGYGIIDPLQLSESSVWIYAEGVKDE